VNYGASESNSTEALGIALLVVGLALLSAGWAYGVGVVQVGCMLVGVVAFFGAFVVLNRAKRGQPVLNSES
jgi:hypothetical protein